MTVLIYVAGIGQARPQLQATLMERMTNVLFRMLNDPLTRAALSAGGEDSLETNSSQNSQQHAQAATQTEEQIGDGNPERVDLDVDESMNEGETSEDIEDTSSDTSFNTATSSAGTARQTEMKNEQTQTEGTIGDQSRSQVASSEQIQPSDDSEFTDLREQLSSLRHGFIEKHGSEPSVSLHYSEQSSTNSTIKLGVGNELDRSNYNTSLPSSSKNSVQEKSTESTSLENSLEKEETKTEQTHLADKAASSIEESTRSSHDNDIDDISISSTGDVYIGHERQLLDRPTCTDIEIGYSDSDDEPNIINRNIHVNCSAKIYQPHVKQKYIGHRNAR